MCKLFLGQVRAIEQIIEVKSGLSDVWADTITVDQVQFNAFTQGVFSYLQYTNPPFIMSMLRGCVTLTLALNAKITGEWPELEERFADWLADAQDISFPD